MVRRGSTLALWLALLLQCSTGRAAPDAGRGAGTDAGGGPGWGAGSSGRERFEAGLELVGRDEARGAEALVALADAEPEGEFAADALAEAALLLEERLGQPGRARTLYARLVERYPGSRPALRARERLAFLDANLRSGDVALGEYQRILSGFAGRPRDESRRRMALLLEAHPDFALAAEALLWLGTLAARDGLLGEAEARFLEVERRFPGSEWAALATKGHADALLASGRSAEAAALYRTLLQPPTPYAAVLLSARAGQEACARALRRDRSAWVAIAVFLAIVVGLDAWARRTAPSPAPGAARPSVGGVPELAYYLPVAGLFVAAALTEQRAITLATLGIAVGGGVLLRSLGRAASVLQGGGRLRPRAALLLALTTVVAVLCLAFFALHKTGLVDLVVETLRSGPDR